jgi:hypothetical protein
MSAPAPEFPEAAANIPAFSFGGYAGEAAGLAGVTFWPRVGARLIDLVVHYCVSLLAGSFLLFCWLQPRAGIFLSGCWSS